MNKFAIIFAGALVLSTSAFAADRAKEQNEVNADVGAIHKDDAAIAKQKSNLEINRAEKADAKAKNDLAAQAGNSVEIGANKTAIEAKKLEKKVDEKILEKDKEDVKAAVKH